MFILYLIVPCVGSYWYPFSEEKVSIDASHWVLRPDLLSQSKEIVCSEAQLDELSESFRPGRRSFGKFNVAVENANSDARSKKNQLILEDEVVRESITDEEMAKRYQTKATHGKDTRI